MRGPLTRSLLTISALASTGLMGCSSVSPPGAAPFALAPVHDCRAIEGVYAYHGSVYRAGQKTDLNANSAEEFLGGCSSDSPCKFPELISAPVSFKLTCERGAIQVSFNGTGGLLGEMRLPIAEALDNAGKGAVDKEKARGIALNLKSGWKEAKPGAWTFGREKIDLLFAKDDDGNLVGLREVETHEVFWFGLPVSAEYGNWFVFKRLD